MPNRFTFLKPSLHSHNLPVYLCNTLAHPLQLKKLRSMGIMEKLAPFDDFKKEANRLYHLEDYEKALDCYEHAYGIYKYLETKNKDNYEDVEIIISQGKNKEENSYRDLALISVLKAMSLSFGHLRNYSEACEAISEALELKPSDPKLLVLRSKFILSNLKEQNIQLALNDIEKAIENDQSYSNLQIKFQEIICQRKKMHEEILADLASSYTKCHWGYELEFNNEKELEHKIIEKMEEKYYEMIHFYLENNKSGNLVRIREEMKSLQMILYKMDFAYEVDENNPGLLAMIKEKSQNEEEGKINVAALEAVKRTYVSLIFNEGKFNEQLLAYCMEKCTEEEKRKQKMQDSKEKGTWTYMKASILVLVVAIVLYNLFL
ncbi:hypothetical protein SteCoe_21786 [Stentor coeruleus]|uniref:Uncharacterized protein n=1 Tax=Stentor coeruleus TaxID=5963 RepID=A0A1R2BNK7_9CILI|nr:hypothetical protein SteCoe_21786 [Stentor coeruleus]